ncbi:MAG: rod shape-determining protein MreD [Tannerella sp.]|jgi:rod shape-determining protein MreD|nr:rod shape-determining protein MreD [Tannerella sp.]
MIRTWLRVAVYFIVFVLLQVLVMNNIHLFRIVTPFIYIYVILKLPVDMTRSGVIMISFLLGLVVDIFSNTFGLHAAACSFTGFVCTPLLERFVDMKKMPEGSIPSYNLFGYARFIRYALVVVTLHHAVLFVVEAFTFFQPLFMMIRMTLSILLSLLLILIIEAFNLRKKRSGE